MPAVKNHAARARLSFARYMRQTHPASTLALPPSVLESAGRELAYRGGWGYELVKLG
jgi:hypothetical protein